MDFVGPADTGRQRQLWDRYTSALGELKTDFGAIRHLGLAYYEYFGHEASSPLSGRGVSSDEGYDTGEDPENVEHAVW